MLFLVFVVVVAGHLNACLWMYFGAAEAPHESWLGNLGLMHPGPQVCHAIVATSEENQASVMVEFYEQPSGGDAALLGQATLTELPAGAAGDVKVRVTAQFSKAGELRLQLIEETSGKEVSGTVATA